MTQKNTINLTGEYAELKGNNVVLSYKSGRNKCNSRNVPRS